jgi:tyrosine-protein phosphatase YwqE
MSFLNILKPKSEVDTKPIYGFKIDFHSHLLPNIDDGCKTFEESEEIIKYFLDVGVNSFITTPHIKADVYNNDEKIIFSKLKELKQYLAQKNIVIEISAAAEYFLDFVFFEKIKDNTPLLTFSNKYILFETSHSIPTPLFDEAVYNLKLNGYKPILAHPERYSYTYDDFSMLENMYHKGVYFQLNINSLVGYYGSIAQKRAELLIDKGMIDFVGSDCHNIRQLHFYTQALKSKYYHKLLDSGKILNDKLV